MYSYTKCKWLNTPVTKTKIFRLFFKCSYALFQEIHLKYKYEDIESKRKEKDASKILKKGSPNENWLTLL